MAAIFVVVVEVSAHKPDKMMPVKDDHVIEHLPSAAADPSFRDSILPGTAISGATGFDTHGLDESDYLSGDLWPSVSILYRRVIADLRQHLGAIILLSVGAIRRGLGQYRKAAGTSCE